MSDDCSYNLTPIKGSYIDNSLIMYHVFHHYPYHRTKIIGDTVLGVLIAAEVELHNIDESHFEEYLKMGRSRSFGMYAVGKVNGFFMEFMWDVQMKGILRSDEVGPPIFKDYNSKGLFYLLSRMSHHITLRFMDSGRFDYLNTYESMRKEVASIYP